MGERSAAARAGGLLTEIYLSNFHDASSNPDCSLHHSDLSDSDGVLMEYEMSMKAAEADSTSRHIFPASRANPCIHTAHSDRCVFCHKSYLPRTQWSPTLIRLELNLHAHARAQARSSVPTQIRQQFCSRHINETKWSPWALLEKIDWMNFDWDHFEQ